MMREFDKRPSREQAEALVRRRIDSSALRYRKDSFGLGAGDRLSDHFELVHLRCEQMPRIGVTPYLVHLWGVKVNGKPAGYIATSFSGDRHKFLPYGFGSAEEVRS